MTTTSAGTGRRSRPPATPTRARRPWLLAAALTVAGLVHVPVIAPHLEEAPWMGWLFVVLTVACALLAVGVLVVDHSAVPVLAAVTGGLAVIGYVATRVVEFPQLADDVGDWVNPLGAVAVVSELVAVVTALRVLRHRV